MHKNTLKFAVSAVALMTFTHVASAADMARRSAPVAVAPAPVMFNWTGFYLGGHVGWAHWQADANQFNVSADKDTFFGGGQVGYNWQAMGSPWVWGVEADVSGSSGGVNVFGTGRARLGYAQGPWMTYATGGVAWANADISSGSQSDSQTHTGWTAGGGVEWAFAPQWSAKVEYLYLGLGEKEYNIGGTRADIDLNAHTVKLGVNYRFGY